MKFGKRLKAAVVEGWVYLDYKGLKSCSSCCRRCPGLQTATERQQRNSSCAQHRQHLLGAGGLTAVVRRREELYNGITQVNVFFLDMERRLLAELQSSSTDDDAGSAELYGQVSDLRSAVILNYLAVLKIAKKHDKHSSNPIRQKVPPCSTLGGGRGASSQHGAAPMRAPP